LQRIEETESSKGTRASKGRALHRLGVEVDNRRRGVRSWKRKMESRRRPHGNKMGVALKGKRMEKN
jgi:hypothetical protein